MPGYVRRIHSRSTLKIAAAKFFLSVTRELAMADAESYALVSASKLGMFTARVGRAFAQVRWGTGRFVNR
jgi:hypothetical protein